MTTNALERDQTLLHVSLSVLKLIGILLISTGLTKSNTLPIIEASSSKEAVEVTKLSHDATILKNRQLECLAKNIYYEAKSEPVASKMGVAQVTVNRMHSGKFPTDLCKVIYQKTVVYGKVVCQFSWTCNRASMYAPIDNQSYEDSMEVAEKVLLDGDRIPALKSALFFHGSHISPGWKRARVARIGNHVFYK